MSLLTAEHLTIRRGGRAIVDDISLAFHAGDFVAVVGPNGAGKSTFLTALAGLSKPDAGTAALEGQPLLTMDQRLLARRRAYLPQNPRAEWPISVERVVALGLIPQLPPFGGFPAAMQIRLDAVMDDCDLLDHRDQAATTLSGGELARAMLARALVGEPDVLIADEPTAGLDPRHALETVRRLSELARRGKLVIAALHDLTLAARYATRLVAINHGKVAADGPIGEALTPGLLREIFEVEACVSGTGDGAFVDFVAAAPKVRPARV